MFEAKVAELLTAILGNYIKPECFSSDRISVAVWSGYVVLKELELKETLITNPTLKLRRGFLGSMEIKIPWNRLSSDSVVITIDDVYLLIQTSGQVNESEIQKQKLKVLEMMYNELLSSASSALLHELDEGFMARLRNKIIDNLEFHVRRIHVRIEDTLSGDHPFALGMTVESLHARSTNATGQPMFVTAEDVTANLVIHKRIDLNHFSCYLNPDSHINQTDYLDWESCSLEYMAKLFDRSIPKRCDGQVHEQDRDSR